MSINFIPNDPLAGPVAPGVRVKAKRANRPASRATFTLSNASAEGTFAPGTPGFLFWQCREAGLAGAGGVGDLRGAAHEVAGQPQEAAAPPGRGRGPERLLRSGELLLLPPRHRAEDLLLGPKHRRRLARGGARAAGFDPAGVLGRAFLETGAFHEAFGDCMAMLTALNDLDTRKSLLAATTTLRKRNFVECTAEELSDGIRRLLPTHNAAEPRHAFNTFQFQIPETLPGDGGPGVLIDEVHSFGMVFTGCFYDLIAEIFAGQSARTEATLLASARKAGALLVEGARTALITPRFFQAVGRAMVLADQQSNAGANRDLIRVAFQNHDVMLGANAMLAPAATLAGPAPRLGRTAAIGKATRKDLLARLGAAPGSRLAVENAFVSGQSFARVVHTQTVTLGVLDSRLRGVTIGADVPVMVGASGGRAAVMGHLPEPVSTEREVSAFVESLLRHGQIEFEGGGPRTRGALAKAKGPISRETHRVKTVDGKKVLVRLRFHCRSERGRA